MRKDQSRVVSILLRALLTLLFAFVYAYARSGPAVTVESWTSEQLTIYVSGGGRWLPQSGAGPRHRRLVAPAFSPFLIISHAKTFWDSYAYTFTSRRFFWTVHSPAFLYSTAYILRLYTDAFLRVFGVFWVSSSGASTPGNAPFARRFTTFFINSFKLCSYPGQSTSPFAFVASLLLYSIIAVIAAIFGRRCAAVVGGPDAFWPVVAVSSSGKGRVGLSECTRHPRA